MIVFLTLLARGFIAAIGGLVAAAPGPLACPSRGARPPRACPIATVLGPEIVLT